MSRRVYTLALRLLLPLAMLWFLWRGWRSPACRGRLHDLLALQLVPRHDRPLWLHAASVGEVQALAPVLHGLARGTDPPPLVLTVGTPTGVARARALYGDLLLQAGAQRAPLVVQLAVWDLPGAAARFLRAAQPRAAIFVETELWPNLLAASAARGVPLALVSARLSARSLRRYQRWAPRLLRDTVRAFAMIGAQSEVDQARFVALGADAARVTVSGNLKFDLQLPPGCIEQGALLRARWGLQRPLWVAGSTHPVEEGICISAQRLLLTQARLVQRVAPVLVLAPRRPERFADVARWLAGQGLRFARSSAAAATPAADIDVLLVDKMGELLGWYAAADVAFVGGSLVPVGGHNLLEPAALGKPVLAGPYGFNAPDAARLLESAGTMQIVRDAPQLAAALELLLTDSALAQARGAQAAAVVAANRGAAERVLALIAALPSTA